MLAVLLLGQLMAVLDLTIVNVAMPEIGASLHASGASLQLVVGGYAISYAMLLITGARLGELRGRRRMYRIGVIVFTVSSLACGLAPDITVLIAARFVQGAGAAAIVPQIISVIQTQFSGKARAKALSGYAVTISVGSVAGLMLGGALVSANLLGAGWRPVFLVNVPIGIVLTALVPRLVPADEPRGTRRLDLAGLALAVPAVFLVVLPLVLGHEAGWPAWTFACIAVGLAAAAVFVVVERRIAARGGDPLLQLDVLVSRGMPAGLTTLFCAATALGGCLFVVALYLQSGLGDSALRAGLTMAPMAAVFGLIGFYWRRLPERIHYALAPAGLAVCGAGYLGISVAAHGGTQGSPLLWAALIVWGAGMGASVSPLMTQSLVNVPLPKAADASGLVTTTIQLGQVVGVAAFGTVFLSLAGRFTPRSPAQAISAAHAISATTCWLALLAFLGAAAATSLARTVSQAKRSAP